MKVIYLDSSPETQLRLSDIEQLDSEVFEKHPTVIALIRAPYPLESEIAAEDGDIAKRVEVTINPFGIGPEYLKEVITEGPIYTGNPKVMQIEQKPAPEQKRRSNKKGKRRFWEL